VRRPRGFGWLGLPADLASIGYVPADAEQRAEAYRQYSGEAEGWPIPLTRCGEPPLPRANGARAVLVPRPRVGETVLGWKPS
jgi:hypothetical protein